MGKLMIFAIVCLIGSAPRVPAIGQQSRPWVGSIPDPSQFAKTQSLADTLNNEAQANDSAGIHKYSEHLVTLLAPDRAGQKYIHSLTDRLAEAEMAARAGKGNLVPEDRISEAYNELMKKVGAPASLLTNETAVRNLRLMTFDKPSDALITMGRNGTNCNPGEAMYLLLSLFWNNGGPRVDLGKTPGNAQPSGSHTGRWATSRKISRSDVSAGRYLQSYAAAHHPGDTAALFNRVAKTMGF